MDASAILAAVNNFVWGPVMLALLVGTGVFLTIRLKFLPWRNLGYALRMVFQRRGSNEGDISPFQSLMTALSATVGTGNIVGVATAMVLGGPGAIVWMFISACFGLSTKYGESVLAVKYRQTNSVGEMSGGPMYAMRYGIPNKYIGRALAALFAFFATTASFGIGNMTQANSISSALFSSYAIPTWIVGLVIAIVDAGFTDLIRPALYQAYHKIENLSSDEPVETYDVVGPICESTDVFAKQTDLNRTHRGDLLAIRSAGAYGEIMASQYNCRRLPVGYTIDDL